MTTRVYLIRHAQADRPDVFHGYESDAGLSELGCRQAAALVPVVAALKPNQIWSSGMRRALLTAQPSAAACGLPLHIEPALHERKVGVLVGTSNSADSGIWPTTLRAWVAGNTAYAHENAESFDDIRQRVLPVWLRIVGADAEQVVVIVAHGIVIRVLLLCLLDGYSVADWKKLGAIHNVSISEISRCGTTWRAERIGEVVPEIQSLSS